MPQVEIDMSRLSGFPLGGIPHRLTEPKRQLDDE